MKKYLPSAIIAATIALSQHQGLSQPTATATVPSQQALEVQKAIQLSQLAQLDAQSTYHDAQNAFVLINSDGAPGRESGGSLIIPKDSADPKSFADLEEDLAVMSRILEKAAGPNDKTRNAMGITVNRKYSVGGGAPRNLYIEGYGALFFLNVNYPLVAPPVEKAETASKPETSTEWEETRRELTSPSPSGFTFTSPPGNGDLWSVKGAVEEFDADKVEELKQDLVAALKNAAHIRKLKTDEYVTVVVNGRSPGGRTITKAIRRSESQVKSPVTVTVPPPGPAASRESKLIVRARRSDIESFQKDKITNEEFRKKASVVIY